MGSSGAPSTWSKLRSRSVLDPEHGIYLDQSGKIGSRSCLCLEKGVDLNQDPPLDDPGRSFDLEQSSIWSSPRPGTYSFAWIMIHVWMNLKALDLDHALAGTALDLEVSRATSRSI